MVGFYTDYTDVMGNYGLVFCVCVKSLVIVSVLYEQGTFQKGLPLSLVN